MAKIQKTTAASKSRGKRHPTKPAKPRRLAKPQYRSFRLHKRIRPSQPKLPSAVSLLKKSLTTLREHWRLFGMIALIYVCLSIVMVRGLSGNLDLNQIKSDALSAFQGRWTDLITAGALFSVLIGSAGGASKEGVNVYQPLLMTTVSLATLWALRQSLAGIKIRAKDAFYKGLYPLVPFILVLLVVGLQLVPLGVGAWLYSTVVQNFIAVTAFEKWLWGTMFFLLALLSLYMACSSLFALLIVTLPDMTPMRALRSARKLVLHRRWIVMRKLVFLPFALVVIAGIIMLPLLLWATVVAEWVFFVLTVVGWIVSLTYIYTLYRELLHE